MISYALLSEAIHFGNVLLDCRGIVVQSVGDNGDREWSVELPGQTIILRFVFDDTIEREREFASLLANGTFLLSELSHGYMENKEKSDELLTAFYITFGALMKEKVDLINEIANRPNEEPEEVYGTVGERGD
jgi:hypothetical protein